MPDPATGRIAYVANDNLLEVLSVADEDGNAITAATIFSVTVKTLAGVALSGASWPLALGHVAGGNWRVFLPSEIVFEADTQYAAHIDLETAAGGTAHWEFLFTAKTRRG